MHNFKIVLSIKCVCKKMKKKTFLLPQKVPGVQGLPEEGGGQEPGNSAQRCSASKGKRVVGLSCVWQAWGGEASSDTSQFLTFR